VTGAHRRRNPAWLRWLPWATAVPVIMGAAAVSYPQAAGSGPAAAVAAARQPRPVGVPGRWRLTLNDGPRQIRGWNTWTGPFNATESDCYSPANVQSYRSVLQLDFTKKPSVCKGASRPYSGAMLTTGAVGSFPAPVFLQAGGYFEARIRFLLDRRDQTKDWPAFWLSAPQGHEIDIAEGMIGRLYQVLHTGSQHEHWNAPERGWHIYGVWVTAWRVRIFYDGRLVYQLPTRWFSGVRLAITVDISEGPHVLLPAAAAAMQISYIRAWTEVRTGSRGQAASTLSLRRGGETR